MGAIGASSRCSNTPGVSVHFNGKSASVVCFRFPKRDVTKTSGPYWERASV